MNSTVALGVAGLVATLLSSALGLYFTYRARTAPYREQLYSRQVQLITEILERTVDVHADVTALLGPHDDIGAHDSVWQRTSQSYDRLAGLSPRAMCTLPTALFQTYNAMCSATANLLVRSARDEVDPSAITAFEQPVDLFAQSSRRFLGVDPLSEETLRLFGSSGREDVLVAAAREALKQTVR